MQKYNILNIFFLLLLTFNNSESRVLEYQQIATQEQLDPYGRLYDFYILSQNKYIGLFQAPANNDGSVDYYLRNLDFDFKSSWQVKVPYFNALHYGDCDYGIFLNEDEIFFLSFFCLPFQQLLKTNKIDLEKGNLGSHIFLASMNTYVHKMGVVAKDYILISYLSGQNGQVFQKQAYDGQSETNPLNLIVLKNYIDKNNLSIINFFVDPDTKYWLLNTIDESNTKTQFIVYNPAKSCFVKIFEFEQYVDLHNVNITLSHDQKYLTVTANDRDYESFYSTGENNLIRWIYSLENNINYKFEYPDKYWAVGKSGQFFLSKGEGLFKLK